MLVFMHSLQFMTVVMSVAGLVGVPGIAHWVASMKVPVAK
jgi:hypothetical protein